MRYRKISGQVGRKIRESRMFARAMQSDAHPILAQIVPIAPLQSGLRLLQ